jgi:hypothetical protein
MKPRAWYWSLVIAMFSLAFAPVCFLWPLDASPLTVPQLDSSALFFPLTPGTSWDYAGTVTWFDSDTQKPISENVSITMKVVKVYQKPELTIAVMSGFPSDLDWSNGQVEPKPSLLIETKNHEIFLNALPPDFDYSKLEKDAASLDKLLTADNLLFRWPLKQGMKFGDSESVKRDDSQYCWFVAEQHIRTLDDIHGVSPRSAEVSLLRYVTSPDDTGYELAPGIGVLSYEYHHHGTVADTTLKLVEFHPGVKTSAALGAIR